MLVARLQEQNDSMYKHLLQQIELAFFKASMAIALISLLASMQICYEYASNMGPAGLMFEGFKEMYDSGHGCPDADYTNLGYSEDPTPASIAKAKSSARETEVIDIWDPTAAHDQVRRASAHICTCRCGDCMALSPVQGALNDPGKSLKLLPLLSHPLYARDNSTAACLEALAERQRVDQFSMPGLQGVHSYEE